VSGYGTGACISVASRSSGPALLTYFLTHLLYLLTYFLGLPLDARPRSDARGARASQVAACAAAPPAAVCGCRREARVHLRAQPVLLDVENHQSSAGMAPSRLHQRRRMPGAAPSSGQPRPVSLVGRAHRSYWACFRHRCIGNHSFGCFVFEGFPHIWIANGCRGVFACHAGSSASPVTQQCGRAGNNNEKLNVCPCEGEV
jgi:hypothetical protein